jgi:hypothetical protein
LQLLYQTHDDHFHYRFYQYIALRKCGIRQFNYWFHQQTHVQIDQLHKEAV